MKGSIMYSLMPLFMDEIDVGGGESLCYKMLSGTS